MQNFDWLFGGRAARRTGARAQRIARRGTPQAGSRRAGFEQLEERLVFALQLDIGLTAISENAGVATATISRTGSLSAPLTVTLSSSDLSEASAPASVIIPANQASATFNVTAVNEGLADDRQTVTITASAPAFADATDTIDVLNDDIVHVRPGAAADVVNVLPGSQLGETDITSGPAAFDSLGSTTYFASGTTTPCQTAGANVSVQSSNFFPVDVSKTYALAGFAKSGDDFGLRYQPNNQQSFGLTAYDIDLLPILPEHVLRFAGAADTTLATPLNPGDTTIHLNNAAGWSNAVGAAAGTRGLAWYGYQDSTGAAYADYTYTRNVAMGGSEGLWTAGSITGNVITLAQPWSGPALAAGSAVRNTGSGVDGSNRLLDSQAVPADFTWTQYAGTFGGGALSGGNDSNVKFRPGTAFVKPTIIANQQGTTTNFISWRDVSLTEVPATTTAADLKQSVLDVSVVTNGDQRYSLTQNSSMWSAALARVDTSQQYTLSGRAINISDTNEQPLRFVSLDIDRKVIVPVHVTKYTTAVDTVLAATLTPGATSILVQNASGWSNDVGETADSRSLAWYGYTDSTGHTYANYTYTRNVAFDFDNGLWNPGDIFYDASASAYRIRLRSPWTGPTILAGSAIRNAAGGAPYNTPTVLPNIDTLGKRVEYAANIGGGTWQSGIRNENQFRPGTTYIQSAWIGTIGDFVIGPTEDNIYGGPTDPTRMVVEPTANGQIAVDLDVLAKGAFGGAATVVIDSVAAPQYGTASILPGAGPGGRAVIHYSASASFVGTDVVMYTLRNTATNETKTSTVSVHFLSGNVTPSGIGKLKDDQYTTLAGQSLIANGFAALGVMANDTTATSARLVSGPAHGTLTFNSDGTFVYTPVAGYVGTDTFRYEADVTGEPRSGVAAISVFSTAESLTLDRLRNIGLAALNYQSSVKRFPAGTTNAANYDANGNPLLSWRVYVLPYLGYQTLYNEFHLDEPWDSANNLPLAAKMPDAFRNAGDLITSQLTRFQIISGEGAPYYWRRSNGLLLGPGGTNFSDGDSNSFFAVETGADKGIVWTKPDPVDFDPNNPLASLGTLSSPTIHAVMADSSTISLPASIDPAIFKGLVTISGGELIDPTTLRRQYAEAHGGDAAVQSFGTLRTDTNLKSIALGLINYHDTRRSFPVGSSPSPNPAAVPGLSWRVLILPFIGQNTLYSKFNLNEPWDSPTNLPLLSQMPDIFRSAGDASDSNVTRILSLASTKSGFVIFNTNGPQTAISIASVADGTTNTIMFLEAGADQAVPWTKPIDLPFDLNNPLTSLAALPAGSFKAAFFDGHVSTLQSDMSATTFSALATRSNREVFSASAIEARDASRMGRTSYGNEVSNIKNIVLAMLNYESARKRYPASSVNASGTPLLSWRVLILPYLEQNNLYDQFNLNEPWDSPHNLALLDQMPSFYRMPGDAWDATTTRFQTFNGVGAPFPTPALGASQGPTPANISDGTSKTILVTETGSGNAVPWTKPTDEPFWLNDPFSALGDLGPNFVTGMFDGSVITRSSSISMDLLKAFITHKGSEDMTNPPPIANVPGFFIYQTAGDTATNEFGADSFDVVLDRAPATNVVLTLAISNAAVAALDKASLTFTSQNWYIPQRVTLRGIDNHAFNADQLVDITVAVNGSLSDDAYDAVASQVFTANIRDDDLKQGDFDRNDAVQQADYGLWRGNFGATSGTGLAADANRDSAVNGGDYVLWRKNLPSAAPPKSGDYDQNGTVQQADFDVLRANFGTSGTGLAADGDHNGTVDAADYVVWRKNLPQSPPPMPGDYDQNGAIEPADFSVWRTNYANAGTGLAADGNHSGDVDAADFVVWRKVLSAGSGTGTVAAATSTSTDSLALRSASAVATEVGPNAAADESFALLGANSLWISDSPTSPNSHIETLAAESLSSPLIAYDLLLAAVDSQELGRRQLDAGVETDSCSPNAEKSSTEFDSETLAQSTLDAQSSPSSPTAN